MSRIKVLIVFGARPEAIKLAPVIYEIEKRDEIDVVACSTGQQGHQLDQLNRFFNIQPQYDLAVMTPNQSLASLTSRCFAALAPVLSEEKPDSGGVQEEAPSLGKPVLVMRNVTERAEGVEAGTIKLTGVNAESILQHTRRLPDDPNAYQALATAVNSYGDGKASIRIADFMIQRT